MHAYSDRRGSARLSCGPVSCAVARALAVIALTLRAAAPSHKIRTHVEHVILKFRLCPTRDPRSTVGTARSRACDFHLQRGEGIVDSGNRVVAKLGGVCVLDLSLIYRVASHTLVCIACLRARSWGVRVKPLASLYTKEGSGVR